MSQGTTFSRADKLFFPSESAFSRRHKLFNFELLRGPTDWSITLFFPVVTLAELCQTNQSFLLGFLMEREFSAGGVVLRKMRGRWFLAVIEPHITRPKKPARKTKSNNDAPAVTALPKGAIDAGEKPDQTALREVHEETGIHADLITKLTDIKYVYVRNWGDQARVFKIVSFYLLLYRSGKLGDISPEMRVEVQRAFWIPLDEANTTLSYKGEREVADKAVQYLIAHPELATPAASASH